MKIRAFSFGIAGGITTSLLYIFLGLLLKFSPGLTLKHLGTIHMIPKLDYIKSFIKVTPQAIIAGVISHAIAGFIIFWLIATIYNLLQRKAS
jgi:hypothetical protein